MIDDNYFKEQRKKEDKLNLGEILEIADDISALKMTLYFDRKEWQDEMELSKDGMKIKSYKRATVDDKLKLRSIHAIIKHGIGSHLMFKLQKLYNLDINHVDPSDDETLEISMNYLGE